MAGSRGPIGKRSDERVRRNKPENEGRPAVEKPEGNFAYDPPPIPVNEKGEPTWHPIAVMAYEAFAASGQSYWAQLTDWAVLYALCEQISREYKPKFVGFVDRVDPGSGRIIQKPYLISSPMNAASLGNIMKTLGSLGFTEGDRRRINMELQRPADEQRSPEEVAADNVVSIRAHLERGSRLTG